MSDQDTTENSINKKFDKFKGMVKKNSNNNLINQEELINKSQISCEEMLKQKLSPFRRSKSFKNCSKVISNVSGTSIKQHSNDLSITLISMQSKHTQDKKLKKGVKFNDEIGKNLIEYIDIECIKEFNIDIENEYSKTNYCKCGQCFIF